MSTIRIGFIGCGNIAHSHVLRLSRVEGVEIVALADPGERGRRLLKQKFGLDRAAEYDDHAEMLNGGDVDAVIICSPHTLHARHAEEALAAGKHVLIEKPMTCSSEEAKHLIATAERAGKVLQVSFQRHFLPPFLYIRSAIADGVIGKLASVTATLYQNWKQSQEGTWRQMPELSGGGMLMDSGSHIIDVLLWTTGLTPQQLSVQLECHGAPVEVDTLTAFRFAEGGIGSMNIIGLAPLGKLKETYAFIGEAGGIFYDNGRVTLTLNGQEPIEPELPESVTDPDRSFVDAILGKHEVLVPGEYALKVVAFTEAIYAAAGYVVEPAGRPDAAGRGVR
ncbi:Gfo/Idh/MocA family oxidoreductase [Paenibacillus hemerocallicola]|uniref:Gfo/Idh/MocA family oxidoreductase n=1 Tax=Paenibacillus hemerocallicola TaxID=1172614 RepID=A0A5C4T3B7_9BACL|nr:Gfo/Idh/MocA family oxidoreductase [Paenibacillus hemerocallicola]TNJ63533.1 Gfo/Idh/MocA family oxidoreductase [Paenibacillus hemerocallicola]